MTPTKTNNKQLKRDGASVSIEIINTNELANRLAKIDPKQIRRAIKLGQLEPGVHFITIAAGEPLFEWNAELVQKLHESCRKRPTARTQKTKTTNTDKINFGSLGLAHLDSGNPTAPKPTALASGGQPKPQTVICLTRKKEGVCHDKL